MPAEGDWQRLTDEIAARLAPHGIDLVHPFAVGWFNSAVEPAEALAAFGRTGALGVLIGNTRRMWEPFLAACRADPILRASADPIEGYVESRVTPTITDLGVRSLLRWAHDPPPRLPIQRLAALSGFAQLSPVGLNVHSIYGPWFALRAAVVLDLAGPAGDAPVSPPVCADCAHTCEPLFQRASAAQVGEADISRTWPLWLAVRDACPVGRLWRYGDDQIRYHYAKDRSVLERASR
jgi:methylmalonic aciduria homocystinuria type C protein